MQGHTLVPWLITDIIWSLHSAVFTYNVTSEKERDRLKNGSAALAHYFPVSQRRQSWTLGKATPVIVTASFFRGFSLPGCLTKACIITTDLMIWFWHSDSCTSCFPKQRLGFVFPLPMSFAYSCACESTAHKSRLTVNFSVSFPKAISHKLRTWKGQKYSVYFAGGSIHVFLQGRKGQDDTMLLTCCDLKAPACMKAVTYLPLYIYLSCQRGPESSNLPGECIDLPIHTHMRIHCLMSLEVM